MKLVRIWVLSSVLLKVGVIPSLFAATLPDFTQLIKENAGTVVQVDSSKRLSSVGGTQAVPEDLLRYFFNGQGEEKNQPRGRSHGSGFFIDTQGYILTNAHV
ncbi:MAG: serine peptidase, partial [Ostreibacterium sp.]